MQEDLHQELRFAVICTIVLDVIIWLLSLLIMGFQIAVLLGFVLGSIGMLANLFLLRRSILNAVHFGKTRDMAGYLLRCLIASVMIAIGLSSSYVNAITAVLPFLYPKVIFGILSVHKNRAERK